MALAEQIIKALGLDPIQLRAALGQVVGTARNVDANLAATQRAVNEALAHFNGRLDRIERLLSPDAPQTGPLVLLSSLNGASHDDGHQSDRSDEHAAAGSERDGPAAD